jgi:hypothetical protein
MPVNRNLTRRRTMSHATTTLITSFATPSSLLRKALMADSILTGLTGLLLVFAAAPVSTRYGLPVGLLRWSGIIFLPFAAFEGWLATRARLQRPAVFAVVACNALWAVDSVLLLLTGWVEPTALGMVFVIAQALFCAVFAELEFIGLRRSTVVEAHAHR